MPSPHAATFARHSFAPLQSEILANVEAGSEVITDEWTGYKGLNENFTHSVVNHSQGEYVNGTTHTNGAENFWTLFKRCIHGTYVSIEESHLFRYVDEQEFRFNERKGKDADRFVKAAGQISDKRLTYKELTDRGDALMPRRGRLPKMYAESKNQTDA